MFEAALQRVLRAVFGGGSSIDIRANLDALQSIQIEHRLGRSLNDFFNGRITPHATGVAERVDLDKYWTSAGLVCPAGYGPIAAYSRKAFSYPILSLDTVLTAPGVGVNNYIGFEDGGGFPCFLAALRTLTEVLFGIMEVGGLVIVNFHIQPLLPADFATERHHYQIKINRCNVELTVDRELVLVVLLGLPETIPTWENNPPYVIGSVAGLFAPKSVTSLFEVVSPGTGSDILLYPGLNMFTLVDGDPLPPRQYALYTESTNTKWNGLAPGAVVTSHPVPVWGYPKKTLVFQATAAGNLDIQVYSGGGWRSWVPGGITLVANQLEVYNLNGEIPIARCVYTRTAAETITLAEWYLN